MDYTPRTRLQNSRGNISMSGLFLYNLYFFPSLTPFTRISSVGLLTVSLEGGNASGYLSPSSSRSNQLVFQWAYLAPPAWHYLLQACLPGIAGPELLSCFSFSLLSSPLSHGQHTEPVLGLKWVCYQQMVGSEEDQHNHI